MGGRRVTNLSYADEPVERMSCNYYWGESATNMANMACSSIYRQDKGMASDGAACNINIQGAQLELNDLPESFAFRCKQILRKRLKIWPTPAPLSLFVKFSRHLTEMCMKNNALHHADQSHEKFYKHTLIYTEDQAMKEKHGQNRIS